MRDINVVVLVGRLTRDGELKYTKSGTPVARFSLAVNRSVKKGDAWEDEVSYFDIDFWGKAAESVSKYLTKGQQVAVEGELKQDRWEQDGQPRSKVLVNAQNVRLMGNAGHQSTQGAQGGANHVQQVRDAVAAPADNFQDDIPF